MIINGRNVKLGMSIGSYPPENVSDFVKAGIEDFEIVIPARLPDPNPLAKSPEERRKNPYTFEEAHAVSMKGSEEKLVALRADVASAVLQSGGRIRSVHLPFGAGWDIAHINERDRADAVDGLKRLIDITSSWNPEVFVIHGCLEPVADCEREARMANSIKSLRELKDYASKYNILIALEDLPRSCLGNTTDEILKMAGESGVRVCFDVNHLLKDSHENFLSHLKNEIIATHLSDYDGIDERHWLPGEGTVPWKLIFDELESVGYNAPYLFELRQPENGFYKPEQIIEAFENALK